ncbi:MAG: hypothetical protein A2W91_19445 [Bacteroidetes bacterium GWF2_38_335]|nr:MAG: hypothetical protein A2W91_19445 [Bacteroidetes bacterium GWF2_38_335]OFY79988.1 MAG: hypothetical protein A2281_10845 [Bacteroidetes bacterium RIFOXYA12_FULL_38_20]
MSDFDTLTHTIHVFVALCDNEFQGIVPVPKAIGNGKDPDQNLYWGCGYGVRTYFKKSTEWKFLKSVKSDSLVFERLVFRSNLNKNYYLVADAYDGELIKQCNIDFLMSCGGHIKDTIQIDNKSIGIYGNSKMVTYTGHDGLMDFTLDQSFANADGKSRDCIILACISKDYYADKIKAAKAYPVIWTTGLMCPEAYTLHDALTGYISGESNEMIRTRAAKAYTKYLKCGEKAARNLLVTGF